MPIPIPESEDKLGECIRFLRKEGYEDNDQRVAICLNLYHKSKRK